MKINSRSKGKRGEYQVRDLFIAHGFPARRGQQFSGSPDSPDVVVPDLPEVHIEVKLVEHLDIHKAMEQAVRDAGESKLPLVFHKKNKTHWLVTLTVEDLFEMLTTLHDRKQYEQQKNNHTDNAQVSGIPERQAEAPSNRDQNSG